MLKCCYSRKKYLSKLKQHKLPGALSKELLFKCVSVMTCEQFIVSIVSQLCCHGNRYSHVVFIT